MERATAMGGGIFAGTVPFLCGLLGAVIANFPISFFGGVLPPPLLAWMPLYFWALVRPDLVPPASVFALGLIQDFLSGGPLGIWAASFLAGYAVVDSQRDNFASLSGWAAIMGFAIATLIVNLCAYLLAAAAFLRFPDTLPILASWITSIVLYIPAIVVMGVLHRNFIGSRRTHL
jgi:rod shape-determining protein MreD